MINNEWERSLDELNRTIQDAIDHQNYGRLNQNVTDTIGRAMGEISRGLKNGIRYGNDAMNAAADNFARRQNQTTGGFARRQRQAGNTPPFRNQGEAGGFAQNQGMGSAGSFAQNPNAVQREKILYLKGTAIKVGGIFLAITGYLGMIVTLIIGLMLLLGSSVTGWQTEINVMAAVMGGFAVAFAGMGIAGTVNACAVSRFGKYVKMLDVREYCDVKELAQRSGRSGKAVVKDLKKMIKKGWFRQGHLDEQETCLMTSNEAYRQYTALMERTRQEKKEKEERAAKEKAEFSKLSPEVQKIIEAGDAYVHAIRAANDAIPGEEISEKIARMEMLVDRIFDRVEQKPDTVSDIRKLMDYYLPMTMKLLQAYEDLDAQPVQGENIISSKEEIEKTIDTLNVAFEKLLDDLFQDTAWDVSSDISVLNTMLAQEGLTEDEIRK
ncbi:5-bromo-4-chloroindolyl phosphate hydrolysis family protein [Mediterraneibacter sp.]|uniref:5-bromo-4-chloroindolyl phosphate hydrolysis family protein n=1 Tax=Mediterraneibacter sp. TaxID=2316022 RepID=UPI0027BA7DAE|nr:5-bromo-4-chloroindolyl phosphate hydrolysis family protein [Mediterraneibacter sp.]